MKSSKVRVFYLLSLSCLTFPLGVFAQTSSKSTSGCDKFGPRTWKVGSIEAIRTQEAAYWGCRMNVPTDTVKQWQQASDEPDRIDRMKIGTVGRQELVFIRRMGGTMRCFSFSVLRKNRQGWEQVWEDYGEEFCMMKCPAIEMRISDSRLSLQVPKPPDPDCKQMFHQKEFIWDGQSFRPAAEHALGGKP